MEQRIPACERTRETLRDLNGGRLVTEDARSELIRLATRLIAEGVMEAEQRDELGRDYYYARGAASGQGYRNGCRWGKLRTGEGLFEYAVPQAAGREESFRSRIAGHLKGCSEALEGLAIEMLARGLSVRDTATIEDVFNDETGRLLLSRTAVSELGERLWADYQKFGQPGSLRVRHYLSLRRRDSRADPARAAA